MDDLPANIERNNISEDKITQFRQLLKALEQANALTHWFAFDFALSKSMEAAPCEDRLDFLNQSLTSDDLTFINSRIAVNQEIELLSHQISLATSTTSFETAWESLQKFTSLETQLTLADQMKASSLLAKLIAIKSMQKLVDVLDAAIKSMKSSSL